MTGKAPMVEVLVLMLLLAGGLAARQLLSLLRTRRRPVPEVRPVSTALHQGLPVARAMSTDCSEVPSTVEVSQHGQLLFAVPMGAGMVGLDCLLAGTAEPELAGLPVHLVAKLPASLWMAEIEQDLVQRWLSKGDPVDVELSLTSAHPKVTLGCYKTTLKLILQVS